MAADSPPRQGRSPKPSSPGGSRESNKQGDNTSSTRPSPGSFDVARGRSRVRRASNPFSEDSLKRRGYHSLLSSFGKVFHVEKRWKLVREMGSGAYGVVISAADEISGETVAIKQVNRVFEKVQLAKRALREIALLRHFSNHENITGLIDVDAISQDFNEIYIFMEPMEADLHQIIKSGQSLTNEHVQYFLYQILRGMKYIHTASVVHRDLKPGNLLVNADCELKICDFGLARGFDSDPDNGDSVTQMTEYVATRWYRAPELMLAFKRYDTAIDVWSIGCIFAELMLGRPLFKGKDYVDQLNRILEVLGTPDDAVVSRIANAKAAAYVRSLPIKKSVPLHKVVPSADPSAIDLLSKMLAFDPRDRISVTQALEHPWLASYHDIDDEPACPHKFERWRQLEELNTLEELRAALWKEIEEYRREVRCLTGLDGLGLDEKMSKVEASGAALLRDERKEADEKKREESFEAPASLGQAIEEEDKTQTDADLTPERPAPREPLPRTATPTDPVISYSRRSSILLPGRRNSSYASAPHVRPHQSRAPSFSHGQGQGESVVMAEPEAEAPGTNTVAFPSEQGYVVPSRSRTQSVISGGSTGTMAGKRLLRTLSTVSIYETGEGLPGGLAGIGPIGKLIMERDTADAPESQMPGESYFNLEGKRQDSSSGSGSGSSGKKKFAVL